MHYCLVTPWPTWVQRSVKVFKTAGCGRINSAYVEWHPLDTLSAVKVDAPAIVNPASQPTYWSSTLELEFPDEMKMTSGSSTVAIAVGQLKTTTTTSSYSLDRCSEWEGEKIQLRNSFTPVQNPVQSRVQNWIQVLPELNPGFTTSH